MKGVSPLDGSILCSSMLHVLCSLLWVLVGVLGMEGFGSDLMHDFLFLLAAFLFAV